METPGSNETTNAQRRKRTIILVIAALGLSCACLVLAITIYSLDSLRGSGEDPNLFPAQETPDSEPGTSLTPSFDPNSVVATSGTNDDPGEAPVGGLGNDILRNDTWQAVAAAAVGQGCDQPIGADSTIEVLQEPDAAGVWVEEWTVACASGDSFAYEVEYILDATGATFNIRSLP